MMNITVGDVEVNEYDELSGFSPVESSSAWDVYGGSVDDYSAVDFNVKLDHEFLDSTPSFADQDNTQWDNSLTMGQSGSSAAPAPGATTTCSARRSIRDILREVKVSEETLQGAVASLGGGAHGLRVLMDHVCFWVSFEAHVADITATIRKGIVDLSNNVPPHHSTFDARTQWKHYSNRGTTGCDLTHRGSAYTRALRKSHIVRQRKHQPRAQRTSKQQCGHPYRGQWRNNEARQSWLDPELGHDNGKGYEVVDAQENGLVDAQGYEFLFQKELRTSDVSSLGRIVLPKKDAERHLPFLAVREGIMISLEDYESGTFWTVRYRFWPNNKSRMYLLENIGGFVAFHRLQEGDFLLCYRNAQGGYVIRGQKVQASARAPAKSPNPTGTTAANETSETTTETKTVDSTTQFMDGDHSTTNTADSSSDGLANSLECSLSDHHPVTVSFNRQPIRFYNSYKPDVLKSNATADPIVEMLLVSNVKQRFMDETVNALLECE